MYKRITLGLLAVLMLLSGTAGLQQVFAHKASAEMFDQGPIHIEVCYGEVPPRIQPPDCSPSIGIDPFETYNKENHNDPFDIAIGWQDRAHLQIKSFKFRDDSLIDTTITNLNEVTNDLDGLFKDPQIASAINIAPDKASEKSLFYLKVPGCGDDKKMRFQISNTDGFGHPIGNDILLDSENFWLPHANGSGCFNPLKRFLPDIVPGVDLLKKIPVIGAKYEEIVTHLPGYPVTTALVMHPENEGNNKIYFRQDDKADGTINRVDGNLKLTHRKNEITGQLDNKVYYGEGTGSDSGCQVTVTLKDSPDSNGLKDATYQSCAGSNSEGAVLVDISNKDKANNPPPANTGDGSEVKIACSWSINPLTWLMCPLIQAASETVTVLDQKITEELTINTSQYFDENDNGTGGALYSAWSGFRYIALGLLLVIALIMVLSQALSLEVIDAYTIKRVMPRLALAVIFISLSWPLMKFGVDISNHLGQGIRALIYSPFSDQSKFPAPTFNTGTGLIALGGVAITGVLFGIIGVLSFALTGLMAVVIAFGVIILRRIIIILLVVVAPIAIIANILPNTQKVWKIWWDFFSRALLAFPIIAAFIATGRVVALITYKQDGSIVDQFIMFAAYFGPYFALPTAFRLAGGAIANISGMANDRTRGVFDRLKKGRQARVADRYQRAKNEKLWNPNNKLTKALHANKFATWAVAPHKNLQYEARHLKIPGLSAQGRRLESDIHAASMEQSEKWLQHVNKHGANDKFYRAVNGAYGGFTDDTKKELVAQGWATAVTDENGQWKKDNEGRLMVKAKRSLKSEKDFHDMAHILGRADNLSDSERKAATALEANAAYTASMYTDPEMNYASTAIGATFGLASHQFGESADVADAANLVKKEAGSEDFAHAVAVQAELIGSKGHPEAKPGYGHEIKNGVFIAGSSEESQLGWNVLGNLGAGDFAGAKDTMFNMNNEGRHIEELLTATGDDEVAAQAVQDKWRKELIEDRTSRGAPVDNAKIESEIQKRLAQKDAVVSTLQQVAGDWSQGAVNSRRRTTDILNKYNLPVSPRGIDPNAVLGGAPDGGNIPPDDPFAGNNNQ